jgi:hypothetical protein
MPHFDKYYNGLTEHEESVQILFGFSWLFSGTSLARKLWLRDDSGLTDDDEGEPITKPYREYGWSPATISIEPNERKKHEKWKTKKKILHVEETKVERCVLWDPSKDDDTRIEFVAYFLRSGNPVFGQGFAPPITFEFRGFTEALGLCVLPTNDATPRRHTMDWVFKHHGAESPRNHLIAATRHTVRAKLKYEVRIAGVAAGDCGERGSRTVKHRQFPIDFIFEHNGISPITEMYEDVELVYYTNIDVLPIK